MAIQIYWLLFWGRLVLRTWLVLRIRPPQTNASYHCLHGSRSKAKLKFIYNSQYIDHWVQTPIPLQVCPQGLFAIKNFFLLSLILNPVEIVAFFQELYCVRVHFIFSAWLVWSREKKMSRKLLRLMRSVQRCFKHSMTVPSQKLSAVYR